MDDLYKRLVASFDTDPFLSVPNRAKKLGVTTYALQRLIGVREKERLDSIRTGILREYGEKHPDATYLEISQKFNVSANVVVALMTAFETEFQTKHRQRVAKLQAEERFALKCMENGALESEQGGTGQEGRFAKAVRMLREDVFIKVSDLARRLNCSESLVCLAKRALEDGGFDRKLEREILLGEFIEKNPTASFSEAAKHLGISEARVRKIPGANKLLPNNVIKNRRDEHIQEIACQGTEEEREMYARAFLRPADYVVEVRSRGWLGVVLPEDEFKRYLECYTRYRCGKANNNTNHLKLQGLHNA